MLEMKCQTALPRLVEQSFLGHLCLKHTDVSALNVSHILAQRGNFSRLSEALLHWDVVCRYSPRKTYPADKFSNKFGHLTKQNLFVAQRFLGHDCLGLHRCVRGQRVMLLHSMEMLFCWLGKSVQPLQSRHPKRFQNAMFQKRQGKQRQHLWHKDSWDTTVEDYTDVSGVNVSCCCTAWRYQQA